MVESLNPGNYSGQMMEGRKSVCQIFEEFHLLAVTFACDRQAGDWRGGWRFPRESRQGQESGESFNHGGPDHQRLEERSSLGGRPLLAKSSSRPPLFSVMMVINELGGLKLDGNSVRL